MKKVLIVDDEEVNVQILANIIGKQGYSIETAMNGKEAVDKVNSFAPDIVLLDVEMPVLNGLEALKEIRKNHSQNQLPVIMITVKDSTQDIIEALDLGANDYVTKPVDINVLLARIRMQLTLKKAEHG